MPKSFADALSPLSMRTAQAVRDIEILRVSAQLDGDDFIASANTARQAALTWAKKRAGGALPKEAWDHNGFELMAGGRNSAAVRITNETMDLWALRAEDPDKLVPGRIWSTEVVIGGEVETRPHLSLRLIVSTAEQDFSIEPHVPGLILQMIDAPGLIRGSRKFSSVPRFIQSENDAEDLCDHLEDNDRRLPVFVVVTQREKGSAPLIDYTQVARATAGLARVVCVPEDLTRVISRRFGKYRAVFDSGVRAYMPGFSPVDDPYNHRLFLGESLRVGGNSVACAAWLRKIAADVSIAHTRLGKDVLDFTTVRTVGRRLNAKNLIQQAAPDAEKLEIATLLVESLEKQVVEKNKEIDGYIDISETAEARARAAEQENRSLLNKYRQLSETFAKGDDAPTAEPPLPAEWNEFLDWLDETYPDRVLMTPAARRLARSPEYEDVQLVARSITWLATQQHDTRINGGGSLRDVAVENGILNAPCGGDTYTAEWKGRRYDVDWHIKNGGSTRDPKRCLRIYYFWEPETQQTIIDYLPSHRKTGMS